MTRTFTRFVQTEATGGVVLLGAAVVALVWANSPWQDGYADVWTASLSVADTALPQDLRHWLNDGLMAVFFFVVGLEVKRELTVGQLAVRRDAALPVIAALGGMVVPALVYLAVNVGDEGASGWGIPTATDIAFAVGLLALLGDRVPTARAERIERALHPWTSVVVLPLFALANAGVVLSADAIGDAAGSAVSVGIALGLVLGKPLGIGGAAWIAVRLGWCRLPSGVGWAHIVGLAAVAGIGFTVSLFIGGLAFDDPVLVQQATIGVLAGSAAAAPIGSALLWRVGRGHRSALES